MGFRDKWRDWILARLKSASISVLVNGSPTKEFSLGRGIRQGDPLSLFLFILAAEGLNILTKAAMGKGCFKVVEIGNDKVVVWHLQYADDTIFIGIGVKKTYEELGSIANNFGCKIGKFPFTYLGIPIGSKMKKLKDWEVVIDKIKSRLSEWKMRTLSFGGRSDSGCKIPWVKWECVISPYGHGGLNFGSLKSKNLALLGKWWWRFKTETNSLWVKIIRSIYGLNGGLGSGGDFSCSYFTGTWGNIILAGGCLDGLGIPFSGSMCKSVPNGASTVFWSEKWLGDSSFRQQFPRLFMLESDKEARVMDRVNVNNITGSATTNFKWLRDPTGRTRSELLALEDLLAGYRFDINNGDEWRWSLDSNGRFSVKQLSTIIDEQLLGCHFSSVGTMRNNLGQKKLEVLAWRVQKKRLPVREELDKRGIDLHSVRNKNDDDDVDLKGGEEEGK
ncbi:uncharacterized protein [Rutidosis leptorrhynchoides]|uniref:uncharacterized protein n=1 Tax=Rutidosis leptorrhynchoides TaxID=125765 RepID=UPI003A991BB6